MHLFAVKNNRGPFITGAWYLMGALASNSFEDMPLTYEKLSGLCVALPSRMKLKQSSKMRTKSHHSI